MSSGEAENGTSPLVRRLGMAAAAVVVILVLFAGLKWFLYARTHVTTGDAQIDANAVDVTSKINERVDKIVVDTNQPVRKGELLIVLDNATEVARVAQARADYQLAVENQGALTQQGTGGVAQAQANIAGASAQVPLSQAGVAVARAQVRVSQAQVPAARENLVKAQADYNRVASLVSTGDLPGQQIDAARAALAQAVSQYRAAVDGLTVSRADLAAAEQRVAASQAGIGAARGSLQLAQGKLTQAQAPSQVAAARAELDIAEQNLAYTKIRSPIDGFVGEKSVEIGQTVGAGMTLLTLIPDSVFITANFKETEMGSVRAGEPVDINVDAYNGVKFRGRVLSINPASQNTYALIPAQNSTGNFVKVAQRIPVKISIDDPDPSRYPLRPGMSVEASVKVR